MRTYKEPKLDKFRKPPICIPTPPEEPEECENKACTVNSPTQIPKDTLSSKNNIINIVHTEAENGHGDDIVDSPLSDKDLPPDVKKARIVTYEKELEVSPPTEVGKPIETDIVATPSQSPHASKEFNHEEVQNVPVKSVEKVEAKPIQIDTTEGANKKNEKEKKKDSSEVVDKKNEKEKRKDSSEVADKKNVKEKKEKVKRSPKPKKAIAKTANEKSQDENVKQSPNVATNGDINAKKKTQKKKLKKTTNESKTDVKVGDCDPEAGLEESEGQEPTKKVRKKGRPKLKKTETAMSESVENKDIVESKLESGELNSAKESSTPPRLKRTPKKNRKYQSDDENDSTKTSSAEAGKKIKKPSPQRKRKLNFEEEKQDLPGDEIAKSSPKKKKKTVPVNKDIENESKQTEELNKNDLPKKKKVKIKRPKEDKLDKEIDNDKETIKPVKKKKVKKANLKDETEAGKSEDSNKENDDGKDSKSEVQPDDGSMKEIVTDGIKVSNEELKDDSAAEVLPDPSKATKPKKRVIKKKKKKLESLVQTEGKDDSENKLEKVEALDTAAGDSKNESEITENESSKQQKEKREPIPCVHCGHVAGGRAALTRHLKKCPRVNQSDDPEAKELIIGPYKCEQCDYSAKKRAMLARHLTIHNTFICLRCPFVGDSRDSWQEHMKADHKDRADQKLCKLCSRYIKCSEIPLEKHVAECKGRTPFTCVTCQKEFKYESSLKSHMISHNPDEPKKFRCTSCDYESNYKANLKKHLKNLHEERIRNIQCPKCDKLFYTEDNMRRHLKLHSQDRPFVCPKCSKTFKTRASMRGHIIVHDPTRPFKCGIDECVKDFRTPKLLKNHQEEFHNLSTKRFHCSADGCDFSFFKRSHLERHEITHTGNNYK